MNRHWNVTRRQAQGERFLRMAAAADVAAARALWKNPSAPVHRRCLAARAIGLLGKHGPSWLLIVWLLQQAPTGGVFREARECRFEIPLRQKPYRGGLFASPARVMAWTGYSGSTAVRQTHRRRRCVFGVRCYSHKIWWLAEATR